MNIVITKAVLMEQLLIWDLLQVIPTISELVSRLYPPSIIIDIKEDRQSKIFSRTLMSMYYSNLF